MTIPIDFDARMNYAAVADVAAPAESLFEMLSSSHFLVIDVLPDGAVVVASMSSAPTPALDAQGAGVALSTVFDLEVVGSDLEMSYEDAARRGRFLSLRFGKQGNEGTTL